MPRQHTTPIITRQCLVCDRSYPVPTSVADTHRGKVCGWTCWLDPRRRAILSFWDRVRKTDTCWFWTGTTGRGGYGTLEDHNGKRTSAHRFSFEMHTGEIPGPLLVCHACDKNYPPGDMTYRLCIRPDHLFLGSHAENSQDMVRKRRNHLPQRKITFEIAQEIRRRCATGESQASAGLAFGISQVAVSRIIRGKCYSEKNYT